MFMKRFYLPVLVILFFAACPVAAQQKNNGDLRILGADSLAVKRVTITDSSKLHTPRGAAIRSAILPGWGQAYNHRYWKIPIVYGALGVTGGVFLYNIKEYNKVRFAYFALLNADTASFKNVAPELQPFITANAIGSLRNYRNEFRKNIDYSVLFFLLFWGLNVVDATVDAHLRGFDVSNELSLKIKPAFNTLPHGVGAGLTFAFTLHSPSSKGSFTARNF
jgi:hypothetical protein